MSRTIIYVHVDTLLDFPITYRNVSVVLSIRMRMSTYNSKHYMVYFVVKNNVNTYPNRRTLMQMCRGNDAIGDLLNVKTTADMLRG